MMGAMQPGRDGSAMMPFAHTEGRIAFIKAELAITDAQTPQWNAFADALCASSKSMRETMANMATAQPEKPWTAADRTGAMVQMMTARLEGMKAIAAAEKALYAVLTDAQKETADDSAWRPDDGDGRANVRIGGRVAAGRIVSASRRHGKTGQFRSRETSHVFRYNLLTRAFRRRFVPDDAIRLRRSYKSCSWPRRVGIEQ